MTASSIIAQILFAAKHCKLCHSSKKCDGARKLQQGRRAALECFPAKPYFQERKASQACTACMHMPASDHIKLSLSDRPVKGLISRDGPHPSWMCIHSLPTQNKPHCSRITPPPMEQHLLPSEISFGCRPLIP